MSAFDESPPFKKRIVSASLTAEQRAEFDRMKAAAHVVSDGALIKVALSDLSHKLGTSVPAVVGDNQPKENEQ